MEEQLLETLSGYLKEEGLDCTLLGVSVDSPRAALILYLGNDEKGRERILEVFVDEQVLPANFKDFEHMDVESGFYKIQIQTPIPVEVQSRQAADIASAINFLNGLLELPSLYFDEAAGRVIYRNVQMASSQEFNKTLLVGIVGMHRMVLDLFTDLLDRIGSGQMTYFEFLDEVVKWTSPEEKKARA